MGIGRRVGTTSLRTSPENCHHARHDRWSSGWHRQPPPQAISQRAGPLALLLVIERIDAFQLTVGAWPRSGDLLLGEEANLRIRHINKGEVMLPFFRPLRVDV